MLCFRTNCCTLPWQPVVRNCHVCEKYSHLISWSKHCGNWNEALAYRDGTQEKHIRVSKITMLNFYFRYLYIIPSQHWYRYRSNKMNACMCHFMRKVSKYVKASRYMSCCSFCKVVVRIISIEKDTSTQLFDIFECDGLNGLEITK